MKNIQATLIAVPWFTQLLWTLTTDSKVQRQASPCGIYGGQSGNGTNFSSVFTY